MRFHFSFSPCFPWCKRAFCCSSFGCLPKRILTELRRVDLLWYRLKGFRTLDDIKKAGTVNIGVFNDKAPLVMMQTAITLVSRHCLLKARLCKDMGKINWYRTESRARSIRRMLHAANFYSNLMTVKRRLFLCHTWKLSWALFLHPLHKYRCFRSLTAETGVHREPRLRFGLLRTWWAGQIYYADAYLAAAVSTDNTEVLMD